MNQTEQMREFCPSCRNADIYACTCPFKTARNSQPECFEPAPAVAVNDDLAKAVHYPDCWDVAAYPTLADALRELATCFQCCECVKNPAVAVNEQMLNALKLYIAHAGEPECAIWRHVQAKVKAAIAAAQKELNK